MNTKEILEYNKRCAEFLGAEVNDILKRIHIDNMNDGEMLFHNHSVTLETYEWNGAANTYYIPFDMLQFHSDWNWIMEVVEAIEKLGFNCEVSTDSCTIHSCLGKEVFETYAKSKKEAVVQAINQFLIWYEQNGKK